MVQYLPTWQKITTSVFGKRLLYLPNSGSCGHTTLPRNTAGEPTYLLPPTTEFWLNTKKLLSQNFVAIKNPEGSTTILAGAAKKGLWGRISPKPWSLKLRKKSAQLGYPSSIHHQNLGGGAGRMSSIAAIKC